MWLILLINIPIINALTSEYLYVRSSVLYSMLYKCFGISYLNFICMFWFDVSISDPCRCRLLLWHLISTWCPIVDDSAYFIPPGLLHFNDARSWWIPCRCRACVGARTCQHACLLWWSIGDINNCSIHSHRMRVYSCSICFFGPTGLFSLGILYSKTLFFVGPSWSAAHCCSVTFVGRRLSIGRAVICLFAALNLSEG